MEKMKIKRAHLRKQFFTIYECGTVTKQHLKLPLFCGSQNYDIMIWTHEGRNKGGVWWDPNWINVWIVSENALYCAHLSIILTDIKIKDRVRTDSCLKIWSLPSVQIDFICPGKKTDAKHMPKKSLIKMIYNNYFSCLTGIKDNFIMNKHYFTLRCVRSSTINALLA